MTANRCLRSLFSRQQIVLGATDGKELLAKASEIFIYIDRDLKAYGCNVIGRPTIETIIDVFEMTQDADFSAMFVEFSDGVDRIFFQQSQVKKFAETHRGLLRRDGYATFLPFIVGKKKFVACIRIRDDDGLVLRVVPLTFPVVWFGGVRRRLIVARQ